jgi:hypothetical protein
MDVRKHLDDKRLRTLMISYRRLAKFRT